MVALGRRGGWRELVRLAREKGWSTERADRLDLPLRYERLELMRRGNNRRVFDIIQTAGCPCVRGFCYHYEAGFGKDHETHELVAAIAETRSGQPGLWIGYERGIESVEPFAGYALMGCGEGTGAADRRVYTESILWAGLALTAAVWALMNTELGPLCCESRGRFVALYAEGRMGPEYQVELVERVLELSELLAGTTGC